MKIMKIIIMGLIGLSATTGLAGSKNIPLEIWNFIKADVAVDHSPAAWDRVTVPHTWNAVDGHDGGSYYRGAGWYQRILKMDDLPAGTRTFLRFQAVGTVADVYVDSQKVAHHTGGYTAFATEITPFVKQGVFHDLRVRADNTNRGEFAPLSGDFTVQGGMHRPAELLIKNSVCISPLDHASPGVALFQEEVSQQRADLRVRVLVDNGTRRSQDIQVEISILDANGNDVAKTRRQTTVAAGTVQPDESVLTVNTPHLWAGVKDPYLYTVKVVLYVGETAVDQYTKKVGFRFVHIDPETGFYLNGESYPLHGVNLHFDRASVGSALTKEQIEEDYDRVMEIGANTVRLAHYPHADYSYELCDRIGLLVWAEIPLVNGIKNTSAFHASSRNQLLDMVKQLGNHCSIFCWSISNEIFQSKTDDPFDLLTELNELCKKTDPTRYTTLASNHAREDLNTITDLFAMNNYPGWYNSHPFAMKGEIGRFNKSGGNRGLGVSEYGAGGAIEHQDQALERVRHSGPWHPEQWQAYIHEQHYRGIVESPECWGSYVWTMFDFSSDYRHEGARLGMNDKGLMTHDHKTRKDVFYFYKANWSPFPMVHLTSKRHLIRNQPGTLVKVYSNGEEVELFVNGKSAGVIKPNDLKIAQWESIALREGDNEIVVKASVQGDILTDQVTWIYDPSALSAAEISARSSVVTEGLCSASSAEAGNGPANVFDGNSRTRWAGRGEGVWIARDLDEPRNIQGLSILWFRGAARSYRFKIEVSTDGNTWRPAYSGASKKTGGAEKYLFETPDEARHIRVICYGSDESKWSSIQEIKILD